MRSITVADRLPERNSCIAAMISAGLRPASGGTDVFNALLAGWQPEHAAAPGTREWAVAAATALFPHAVRRSWFFSGTVRMRLPVAAKIALRTAGAATKIVGSPTPPQNPPDGMMMDSTFGISSMRKEL